MSHPPTGRPQPAPVAQPTAEPVRSSAWSGAVPRLAGRGLVHTFGSTPALAGVDVDVEEGRSLAVMGPSGSGKSTLLHVLAGILVPTSGVVSLDGREVQGLSEKERSLLRRSRYGFVF